MINYLLNLVIIRDFLHSNDHRNPVFSYYSWLLAEAACPLTCYSNRVSFPFALLLLPLCGFAASDFFFLNISHYVHDAFVNSDQIASGQGAGICSTGRWFKTIFSRSGS